MTALSFVKMPIKVIHNHNYRANLFLGLCGTPTHKLLWMPNLAGLEHCFRCETQGSNYTATDVNKVPPFCFLIFETPSKGTCCTMVRNDIGVEWLQKEGEGYRRMKNNKQTLTMKRIRRKNPGPLNACHVSREDKKTRQVHVKKIIKGMACKNIFFSVAGNVITHAHVSSSH